MPDRKQMSWMRVRLYAVCVLLIVATAFLIWRIWNLQIAQSEWLGSLAKEQYLEQITLEPMRGAILDRNGAPMAVSVMADSVFVMPDELHDPAAASRALARALSVDARRIERKLRERKHFTWIKRRILPSEASRVRALDLPGVHFTRESRRYYPARELAASLIGFAGDGRGLEGLELVFDSRLRGSTVLARGLRDARGNVLFSEGVAGGDEGEGLSVVLTVDLTLQEIAERELARAVSESQARSGLVVVLEPSSGDVLALANTPPFNPNVFWRYPSSSYRNRSVTDCFEPGSTMKVFTLAAALEHGIVKPDDVVDCQSGELEVGRHTIHDAHRGLKSIPLREVLVHSSNVGSAKIGMTLGAQHLWRTLHDFGFGRKPGSGLPGEARCMLREPGRWADVELATISFGQGISVSALQMTAALGAVANGGVWMQPRIVREIRRGRDRILQRFDPQPAGRVLNERWARELTEMMVGVTEAGGTGIRGAVPGFRVAGKTGTAQKADLIAGGYSKEKRVASFMGFAPAEQPRIVVVVVVDEPGTSPYGGVVAAPAFARIVEASLKVLGVFPAHPVVAGPADESATAAVEEPGRGEAFDEVGVSEQVAAPRTQGERCMPDVRGLSVRQALLRLGRLGLDVSVRGSGRVLAQQPAPGARIDLAGHAVLVLERESVRPADSASRPGRSEGSTGSETGMERAGLDREKARRARSELAARAQLRAEGGSRGH